MRASKNKSSSGSKREPQSQGVYTYLGAKIFDLRPFLSTGLFRDKNIPLSTHDQILWPLCSQSLFFVWELSLRRKGCSVNGPDLSSQPGSHLEHHHEGLCRPLRPPLGDVYSHDQRLLEQVHVDGGQVVVLLAGFSHDVPKCLCTGLKKGNGILY